MEQILLKAQDLKKEYQSGDFSFLALNQVEISLKEGEQVFVVGASGSGKSTLLKALLGLIELDAGQVFFANDLLEQSAENKIPQRREASSPEISCTEAYMQLGQIGGLAYLPQSMQLLRGMTLRDNLLLPLCFPKSRPLTESENQDLLERMQTLVKYCGLSQRLDSLVEELSGGEARRALLVRALMTKPKLLIADEPTSDLDPQNRRLILDLLEKVHREEKMAQLIVTHDLEELASDAKLLVMKEGELQESV